MIELNNITRTYTSGNHKITALFDINLKLDTNGLVIIMGPSGCGKTTLLNTIALIERSQGTYMLQGREVSSMHHRRIDYHRRHTFGYLFQHFHLIKGFTAFENVLLGLYMAGYDEQEAIKFGHELFSKFGLAGIMNQDVTTLSGGEAQRIGLMRALAKKCPIILADEPTGALDSRSALILMETLVSIAKEKLVIMVTHNRDLAHRYGDRIIHMEQGKIISDTTKSKLSNKINKPEKQIENNHGARLVTKKLFKLSGKYLSFATLSLIFGIVISLLSIGLDHGSQAAVINEPLRTSDAHMFRISRKTVIPVENTPLNLLRYERPEPQELTALFQNDGHIFIGVSFEGLLSNHSLIKIDQTPISNLGLYPLCDFKHRLFQGDDFHSVVINHQAAHKLSSYLDVELIGQSIDWSLDIAANYVASDDDTVISDLLSINQRLIISAIIDDHQLIQEPRIYYDYFAVRKLLENTHLVNLSTHLEQSISWYDRIIMASQNEVIGGNELIVATFESSQSIQIYNTFINLEKYALSGSYVAIRTILKAMTDTVGYGLLFFSGIAMISSLFLLILTLIHIYAINRQRLAIAWQLGFCRSTITKIYLLLTRTIAITSSLGGLVIAPIVMVIINRILYHSFGIERLLSIPYTNYLGLPFALPIIVVVFIFMVSEIVAHLLMHSMQRHPLIEELRDHD